MIVSSAGGPPTGSKPDASGKGKDGKDGAADDDEPLVPLKDVVTETFVNFQVAGVQFTALTDDEIAKYGELEVVNPSCYHNGAPLPWGPLDRRMGAGNKKDICNTCGQRYEDCSGHFGHVRLALPVFHAGFFRHTVTLLQCICKTCARVLLRPEERARYLSHLRKPTIDDHKRQALFKRMVETCKKIKSCYYCPSYNSQVKRGSGVPLILKHAIAPSKNTPDDIGRMFVDSFCDARNSNKDVEDHHLKANEDLNPLVVHNLFKMMTHEDQELLGITSPERLVTTSIPVPPLCIRPTVTLGDSGQREDDMSECIQEIVEANNMLKTQIARGQQPRTLLETWQFLQEKCATMVNSEMAGLNLPKGRPIRSICSRLKGKEGRFRGNLSGKRVDFSGRTVISPDPNVSVEQLVVPEWVARRLTFPEKVCEANIARLRETIRRGPELHPGAAFVRMADGRGKFLGALRKNFRRQIADELACGDTVERHMHDGDVVLFNRQPSLHRLSIMAHRAKVMPGRTMRFNECACSPYNADFDGDEMNIHFPQTEEAKAEALELMGIRHGLVTPKSGEVEVCATQDFLTGAFLLTQRDTYFTRDSFCQLCAELSDGVEAIDLPPPSIVKPVEMWTGKQAFSILLRPNKRSKVLVNIDVPEKNYCKKGESMCPNDGYVVIRNSEVLCGNLGKKILGGAKNGIFFRLLRDSSADAAIDVMSRLAKVASRWLMNRGMTIGIDDVHAEYNRGPVGGKRYTQQGVPEDRLKVISDRLLVVEQHNQAYNNGTLTLKPGCTAEQTLEAMVNGELGQSRDLLGVSLESRLPFANKPRIMAMCGSKGSAINLCQMMALLGQQNVSGQRIKNGFVNRTLPHFEKGAKEPKARGYVKNSFYTGLEPPEFFFHTMGGREGLVDTAVKTAETGYMARRLMKALEDMSLKYDLTVRTSRGDVVQFTFGDDGLNPARMEGDSSKLLDYDYIMNHVRCILRAPTRPGVPAGGGEREAAEPPAKRKKGAPVSNAPLPLPPISDGSSPMGSIGRGRAPRAEPLRRPLSEATDDRYVRWPLLPHEISVLAPQLVGRFLAWIRRTHGSADLDVGHAGDSMLSYLRGLAKNVADMREKLNLERGDTPQSSAKALHESTPEDCTSLLDSDKCPTQRQLEAFVNRCAVKYVQAQLMAGEAVGAVAAQSIAEPATQMTLKTFHFAGVASMNVTLGVPRIKEIINGAKTISTPIISLKLVDEYSDISAKIVKGRIERTTLGDICSYFKEVFEPASGVYISVKLNLDVIRKLQLEIDMQDIKDALRSYKNLDGIKLAESDIKIVGSDKIRVKPPLKQGATAKQMYFQLYVLKKALPHAVVVGLPSIRRAVINRDEKKGQPTRYEVLVEGYGFREVLSVPGVDVKRTASNHVDEVEKILGIEAARRVIMEQIKAVVGGYGIIVDSRHIQMLGDCMTYRGMVLGINRYGISRMSSSTLMLASFERTADLLFDAAVHKKRDAVVGVSESIIMGSNVNLGTGLFKVLWDFGGKTAPLSSAATGATLKASSKASALTGGRTPLISAWR